MAKFGESLRAFRQASNDPDRLNRRLSQERLGELMGHEMGDLGFSGAAVSDWERGESKINAADRQVLISLLQVLHRCGGLNTLIEANHFLESGYYRTLVANEAEKIFSVESGVERAAAKEEALKSGIQFLIENFFAVSEEEFQLLVAKSREGPPPSWPRVLAALMRKASDSFSMSITTILWVWVWLINWWLMAPSLRLPFANEADIIIAMQRYILGTLIVPLLIGLLVDTKNDEYWKRQPGVNALLLRLYTYQGAGIGLNLGYFFVFPFSLARFYLQLDSAVWVEIAAATLALILGNMGARVVPHNLWLAYGRLKFSDGAIFFVVALVGPFWGFFFLEFYPILLTPVLGILMILLGVSFTVIITKRRSKKQI